MSDAPYKILFVCTANICRSPAAEALARHRYGEQDALFRSAGLLDGGRSCPEYLVQTLQDRGIDIAEHRSYQLDPVSLQVADLVLTMEGEHVQQATTIDRTCFPKTVPLREAAQLLATAPGPQPMDRFIEMLSSTRDPSSYLSNQWDIDDPYRRKLKDYRRAVDEISSLVEGVIGRLS
ncbi:MAG: low molecular weight phosphatase family protein [Acidimicrobiales bacterium]